jgi:hypothetical protein
MTSTAFVDVHKDKGKALDNCSEEWVLIGYNLGNTYGVSTLQGSSNVRNKAEPPHIFDYDEDEDKKEGRAQKYKEDD